MTRKRKPYELTPRTYDLSQFHWDKEAGALTAEASDFEYGRSFFGRLYSDACDEGFAIHSPKTGNTITVSLVKIHKDSDGDITYWEFAPTTTLTTVSKVIVFND